MSSADASPSPLSPTPTTPALHARALDDLRYIRQTMERAGSFTAVSGWGIVAVGVIGLGAALVAAPQSSAQAWIGVWLASAVLSATVALGATLHKARRVRLPVLNSPARKLALSFAPTVVAGGVLTWALWTAGAIDPLPGLWLTLYGAGVIAAGTYSVRVIPVLGASVLAVGVLALLLPAGWGNALMAVGFGAVHVLFGLLIAWRHGG